MYSTLCQAAPECGWALCRAPFPFLNASWAAASAVAQGLVESTFAVSAHQEQMSQLLEVLPPGLQRPTFSCSSYDGVFILATFQCTLKP